ncbi:MAG: glycosyltransferase family 87 protein [Bacteroidota bacterium]
MQIAQNLVSKTSVLISKKVFWALLFIGTFLFLTIESFNKGDFHIFLEASKSLFNGENIYEKTYFDGYHYFYSLLFTILIYPLTFLPVHLAVFLWLCFSVFLIHRLFLTIGKLLPISALSSTGQKWFWVLISIFSLRLILENIHVAQITILLLYLCVQGLYLIHNKKVFTGAALIALGINIKLLPIVLLPYLLYRRQFKAAALVVGFSTFFLCVPILFIEQSEFEILITTWLHLVNPFNTQHVLDVEERSFHSLTTLISTLFVENVPDVYALKIKRNIADVSFETLNLIITGARLFLIAFTLYFLRSMPFKKNKYSFKRLWEISYILCLIPLIFPHQQHYAFLFILPAYSYCIYYMLQYHSLLGTLKKRLVILMLILIYLMVNMKLLLGSFNDYYEHFKILTYGAVFLLVTLSVLVPHKSLKNS